MLLVGVGVLLMAGCRQPGEEIAGNYRFRIQAGGLEREYLVHVPPQYSPDRPTPVVMMFHGGGGTAQSAMVETKWDTKAAQEGFLAVFPEGSRPNPERPASFLENPQTWNDGSGRENVGAVQRNVDDVAFITALLADIMARFNVDRRRIYAVGFSNGGAMVFRLGRELSSFLAAIACVAATDWLDTPEVATPVAMLYMTGTADPLNPIDGGEVFIGQRSYGVKPPVQQSIDKWVEMLGCPADPITIYASDGVLGVTYRPCTEESEVVLYTIDGLGHWWPGWIPPKEYPSWLRDIFGEPSDKIMATEIIWEFFRRHQKK